MPELTRTDREAAKRLTAGIREEADRVLTPENFHKVSDAERERATGPLPELADLIDMYEHQLAKLEREVSLAENELQDMLAEGLGYTYDEQYGYAIGDHIGHTLAAEARDVLLGRMEPQRQERRRRMVKALQFYANGDVYKLDSYYDSESGEWQEGTSPAERDGGKKAKEALKVD